MRALKDGSGANGEIALAIQAAKVADNLARLDALDATA